MKGNSFVVKVLANPLYSTLGLLDTTITATIDSRISRASAAKILQNMQDDLTFDGVPISVFGENGAYVGAINYTIKMLARVRYVMEQGTNPFGFKVGDVITLTGEYSVSNAANMSPLKSIIATAVNDRLGPRGYDIDVYNIVMSFSVKE